MTLINEILTKAKEFEANLLLPELNDARVKEAARIIEEHGIAKIINKTKISMEEACNLLVEGKADGIVAGATWPTKETLKPAIKIVGVKNKIASSFFLMVKNNKPFLFADCAFNVRPTEEQLAQIASDTCSSAKMFNIIPKVAFLSFSTKGSAKHEDVEKTVKTFQLFKKSNPSIIAEGEIQFDAAIIKEIGDSKAPNNELKGEANIFIFPDLNSGNIAYKIAERWGEAKAIGPINQGFKKPVNDLSRGCSVEDIVLVAAVTVLQTKNL